MRPQKVPQVILSIDPQGSEVVFACAMDTNFGNGWLLLSISYINGRTLRNITAKNANFDLILSYTRQLLIISNAGKHYDGIATHLAEEKISAFSVIPNVSRFEVADMKWPVKPNINPVPRTVSLFPAQSISVAHFLHNQASNTSTIWSDNQSQH